MKKACGLFFFIFLILLLPSCDRKNESTRFDHLDRRTKIRLRQYLAEGKQLYEIHCANCHQQDGSGLAKLYPPLKDSDYLIANKTESICGMRYGQKGEILVNGVIFNQEMPAIPNITDLEIAEIATYIYTEFADSIQIVTINEVRSIMESCQSDSMNTTNPGAIKNP